MAGVVLPYSDPEWQLLAQERIWSDPYSIDTVGEAPKQGPWSDPKRIDTTKIVVVRDLDWFIWDGTTLTPIEPLGVLIT